VKRLKEPGAAWIVPAVVLLLGLLLTAFLTQRHARRNREVSEEAFRNVTDEATARLVTRLATYEYGLRGIRGIVAFTQHPHLTSQHFRAYARSRDIDHEFPGARGMGIIQRVPTRRVELFLDAARADVADFRIRQLGPHPGELFVIQYVEPLERNREAVGLDIASERYRREAALDSMQSGQARLTAPITILQALGKQRRSFLLMLPIFLPGRPLDLPDQRESACIGWSYAPLVMDEVLADFDLGSDYSLTLKDVEHPAAGTFFASRGSQAPAAAGLERRLSVQIYGRTWEAHVKASPAFVNGLHLTPARWALGLGAAASVLLAFLGYLFAEGRRRDAQLRLERERRAVIVDTSQDAIIGEALDGTVIEWNRGAERLFGYSAAQALGRRTAELILPPERAQEDADMRDAIARGEDVGAFDSTRTTSDGRVVDVSIVVSPLTHGAERSGLSKTIRDISDAKRAELAVKKLNASLEAQVSERTALLAAALREHEMLLNTLHAHAIVSVTDARGSITDVNQHFCAISGYTREELLGQNHRIVNSGHHGHAFWVGVWRAIGSGVAWRGEVCNRRKDGSLYWVDSMIAPFFGADGRIEKYVSIRFDITAQKAAEQDLLTSRAALQIANERTTLATDGAGIGIWEFDLKSGRVTWDAWTYRLYGRSEDTTTPSYELWAESLHSEDRERVQAEASAAIAGRTTFDTDYRIVLPSGKVRHHKSSAKVVRDGAGVPLRMTGLNFDITQRKRAELRLQETSTVLQAVLEAAAEVSLIATDRDFNIKIFNRGAERLLGYRANEIVNRGTPLLLHDAEEVRSRAEELSRSCGSPVVGGEVFMHPQVLGQACEWTYVRKDGSRTAVSLVVTPLLDPDGRLLGYLAAAYDVSPQKAHEASLRQAMQRAEQASVAKSQFLANMSHEIRTPMNAVIGLSYLLLQTALDAEQASLLTKIRVASKSLLSLLNDILDFSKIEAGELSLERTTFSLLDMLSDLKAIYQVQAKSKGIELEVLPKGELPTAVRGDLTRLSQILSNLLSNALKFTEQGTVELTMRCEPLPGSALCLHFEVQDTGVGIPLETQARLFAPFVQADDSTTRRFGGTGLGLSIVKHLAEMMGGKVGVVSAPGKGSTFWGMVVLEIATPAATKKVSAPQRGTSLRGLQLLVVDDSDINQYVAKRILAEQGATITLASNGREAVEILRTNPTAFAAVLMDIQMPEMDGHEATRITRGELGLSELPIIALTADARASERQAAFDCGMSDFVVKPFEPAALIECLLRHAPASSAAAPEPESTISTLPHDEWPSIEGIDLTDAKVRLQNDRQLFLELLTRLAHGFRDLGSFLEQPDALSELGRRMHKLRGGAGQIGAKGLSQLAERIEQACRADDFRRATAMLPELEAMLQRLSTAVERLPKVNEKVLARPSLSPAQAAEAATELLPLLEEQSLDAIDRAKQLAPALQALLEPDQLAELGELIDSLRFAEAHQLLQARLAERDSGVQPLAGAPAARVSSRPR
jgi:PAS domain S-box-containing protein